MSLLELILIFVLQFEGGISGNPTNLFSTPGHLVTLPCDSTSPSDNTTCSRVTWFYTRDSFHTYTEVQGGNVRKDSARAARLSLGTRCSLVINSITAEDAGLYICPQGEAADQDADVYLNVLTISPSPPDADPKRDGEITLECSLLRYIQLPPCQRNRIRWVDETGTVLDGEGVGYEFLGQTNCVSRLSVKRQSGHNRRYTCQRVDRQNNVQIQADYTPVFSDDQTDKPDSDPTDWFLSYFMLALRIAALILMIVITFLIIRYRGNIKPCDHGDNVNNDADEVSYENVEGRPAPARLS